MGCTALGLAHSARYGRKEPMVGSRLAHAKRSLPDRPSSAHDSPLVLSMGGRTGGRGIHGCAEHRVLGCRRIRVGNVLNEIGKLSEAAYVRTAARAGIGSKSALIEYAAIARGLATTRWSSTEVLIQVPGEAAPPIYFHQMNGPRSIGGRFYCDEKTVARDLLGRAG